MLDDYINSQMIAYKIISNQINKDMINHAYIIETNGNNNGIDFAKAIAKSFLCPFYYKNLKKCENCKQCEQIDNNDYIELKIIEPQGMWITKPQIEELQNSFIKKAIVGSKKIYIINHFDQMKANVMDSLLKFIEEPEPNIIAILITDNLNTVADTIISRCQIISMNKETRNLSDNYIDNINKIVNDDITINEEMVNNVIKYINYLEHNKNRTILFQKELWFDKFKDNRECYVGLNIMLLFYQDCFNYILNKKIRIFQTMEQDIQDIVKNNDEILVAYKLDVIMNTINKLKYNANINLLMDKLILDLEKR